MDPGVIKSSSNDQITLAWESPFIAPLVSVTQTTSNGFLYYSELSPPGEQKVEIKRKSVSNLLDQHQRLSYW